MLVSESQSAHSWSQSDILVKPVLHFSPLNADIWIIRSPGPRNLALYIILLNELMASFGNSCFSLATMSHHRRFPKFPRNTFNILPKTGSSFSISYNMDMGPATQLHQTVTCWGPSLCRQQAKHSKEQTRTNWQWIPGAVWSQKPPTRKGPLQSPAKRNDCNRTLGTLVVSPVILALIITKSPTLAQVKTTQFTLLVQPL